MQETDVCFIQIRFSF